MVRGGTLALAVDGSLGKTLDAVLRDVQPGGPAQHVVGQAALGPATVPRARRVTRRIGQLPPFARVHAVPVQAIAPHVVPCALDDPALGVAHLEHVALDVLDERGDGALVDDASVALVPVVLDGGTQPAARVEVGHGRGVGVRRGADASAARRSGSACQAHPDLRVGESSDAGNVRVGARVAGLLAALGDGDVRRSYAHAGRRAPCRREGGAATTRPSGS